MISNSLVESIFYGGYSMRSKSLGMHPDFNSYLIMIMVILFRFLSHENAAKMFFKFLEITLSRIRVIYCNPTGR